MIYDVRVDVIDPESGKVVAERGETISDPQRLKTIRTVTREARKQGVYHYTISRVGSRHKIIE